MGHHRLLRFARAWSFLSGSLLVLGLPACGSSGPSSVSGLGGSGGSGTGGSSTGGTGGSNTGGTGGSSTGGTGGSSTGGRGGTGGGAGAAAGGRGGTGATGTGGSAGGSGTGGTGGTVGPTPPVSPYIVVDQFGYLPDGEKIAVIRDPQTGFDASESFTPGATLRAGERGHRRARLHGRAHRLERRRDRHLVGRQGLVVHLHVGDDGGRLLRARRRSERAIVPVHDLGPGLPRRAQAGGAHALLPAGRAEQGRRPRGRRLDRRRQLRRARSRITTAASTATRTTPRPSAIVWGGWYDAGDLNKYTSWTAGYVESLLRAYAENPTIWTDDYNIPESGNGIPDVLDEAKWGLDYLARLQGSDGSVLSIVGEPAASPPSSATGQSLYGPANTSATLATAAAFAAGARMLRLPGIAALNTAADDLPDAREERLDLGGREPGGDVQEQRQRLRHRRGSGPVSRRRTTTGASSTSSTPRRSCSPPRAMRRTERSSTPTTTSFTSSATATTSRPGTCRGRTRRSTTPTRPARRPRP